MTAPGPGLSIAIIDANPLLADGLAVLLLQDPGFAARVLVVGPSGPWDAAGELDVIILDPGQTESCPTEMMRKLGCRARAVLGYCSTLSDRLARACIAAGFRGILPKTVSFETLKVALATTAQGGIFIDAAFAAAIAPDPDEETPRAPVQEACLSARELFVLKSVAHGKSMKEIGKELDLSCKTIETYKARGSSKLNLSGRRQIVEFAIAQGWVDSSRAPPG